MTYYEDVYKKRLNRYGTDFKSRVQGEREADFENYLSRSVYTVSFTYNSETKLATLEPYKQSYIETQAYFLTQTGYTIPDGTIIPITKSSGEIQYWMIWWLENMEASGYNRYVVLHLNTLVTWTVDNVQYQQYFYFQGPGYTKINDTAKATNSKIRYLENNNNHLLVSKRNDNLINNTYFEIVIDGIVQGFQLREKDIVTNPGIGYYTIDPVPERLESVNKTNSTSAPTAEQNWLGGQW